MLEQNNDESKENILLLNKENEINTNRIKIMNNITDIK